MLPFFIRHILFHTHYVFPFLLIAASLTPLFAREVTIQNTWLKVTADEKKVSFYHKDQQTPFSTFPINTIPEKSSWNILSLPVKMDGMDAAYEISLFEKSPFAFITLNFRSTENLKIEEFSFPEITLSETFSPSEYKVLGTAGLTSANKHPGSYMFLAVAHPETRNGVIISWLTSTRGNGILFSNIKENQITVRPVDQYGRWELPAGIQSASEILVIGAFPDARFGLEAYAEEIAKYFNISMKPAPSGYCTWYSNKYGGAGNENSTQEFAEMAVKKLKPYGFSFFQIDDKWQMGNSKNGPNKNFMEHRPNGPYPSGMKKTAEYLSEHDITAGIWFMPFSGTYDDPYYADKQSWFVKSAITYPPHGEKNTRRYKINQTKNQPYETYWGGTCLDMTNPAVQNYLKKEVSQIANDWGYKYFKIDGMWTGMACEQLYVNDAYRPDDLGKQIFYNPGITNVEAFRNGCQMVREAGGDNVFILGCNISQNMRTMGASYGLVDAMRIGPDNGSSWARICSGPIRGTARYFYNARVWWNDPDPVYVRDSIPLEHARLITSWAAITGQLYAFSDWLPDLSEERVEVLRRTMQNHQKKNVRPVDLFNSPLANVWLLSDKEYHILALFNWKEKLSQKIDYSMKFIGLDPDKTYVGYDFWNNTFLSPIKENFLAEIPAGSCKIIALRELRDRPVLLSTSRHVASPILEVENETWDPQTHTLSGTSSVVADDDYELRLIVPTGNDSWELIEQTADHVSESSVIQDGCTIRVRFTPKQTGKISWKLKFKPAKIDPPKISMPENFRAKAEYGKIFLTWKDSGRQYLLKRNDQLQVLVAGNSFTDYTIQPGTSYTYTLSTKNWLDSFSEPVKITVTSLPSLKIPPVPPKPEIHISDLTPVEEHNGNGPIRKNVAFKGSPLTILGEKYEKGIGVHANSLIVYKVPENATRFVATVGIDDAEKKDDRRSIQAKIYFIKDGTRSILMGETPVLRNDTVQIWHFDLPLIKKPDHIQLEINDTGDGIMCDHGNWVNTGFILTPL
ncbi:MAG: NPCBM/NEW2 domain-containing protein [Planctomycetia bacterium]|nr:NPCBM/NEW2 domain-containing protein [Planctomycetia bacterium]